VKVIGIDTPEAKGDLHVFAVLVGAARLLADFRGIRKWANCAFVARPELGPNDGFLSVHVRTHNGCGLAAGSEVLLDLGERYVPMSALNDPPAKKFKGALDLLLNKQRRDQAKEAESSTPQTAVTPKTAETAVIAATGNAAKPPPATTPEPAVTTVNPPPQAAAAAELGASAGSAASSGTPAGAASGDTPAGGASFGGCALGRDANHCFSVVDNKLVVQNTTSKNVKLYPHTVAATISQGELREIAQATSADVVFSVKPSQTVLLKNASGIKAMQLSKVIIEHKVNSLYQHASWPAGTCPTNFTQKKTTALSVSAEMMALAAATRQQTQWLWIVEVKGSKIMPVGASLCLKKQTVLPAGKQVELL